MDDTQTLTAEEIGALLAVATLYVDAFSEDEMMTLPEKLRLQEIEAILERQGRRLKRRELDAQTGGLHPAELCGEDCSGCCDE